MKVRICRSSWFRHAANSGSPAARPVGRIWCRWHVPPVSRRRSRIRPTIIGPRRISWKSAWASRSCPVWPQPPERSLTWPRFRLPTTTRSAQSVSSREKRMIAQRSPASRTKSKRHRTSIWKASDLLPIPRWQMLTQANVSCIFQHRHNQINN